MTPSRLGLTARKLGWLVAPSAMAWIGARVDFHWRTLPDMWGASGPLNGQQMRLELITQLLASYRPTVIVETGTFRGSTTAWFASWGIEVISVEVNRRYYLYSKYRLRSQRNVRLFWGDTRRVLQALFTKRPALVDQRLLFYLDAHSETDHPVGEELETIESYCRNCVIVIDDFRVDDDEGYGYDSGEGWHLGLHTVPASFAAFWPTARAIEETGGRRGAVLLGRGDGVTNLRSLPGARAASDVSNRVNLQSISVVASRST